MASADIESSTAIEFKSLTECIEHLLSKQKPMLVVVGSSHEDFLHNLSSEFAPPYDYNVTGAEKNGEERGTALPPLLSPTIKVIARSRNIRLAFASTLMHLRAYLSALNRQGLPTFASQNLVILNLLELHRYTNEFSAQGISRTVAVAVDAAFQHRLKLQIIETSTLQDVGESNDQSATRFEERIPILNGGLRSLGGERVWAGRTIKTGAVLAKWFKLRRGGKSQH
ncbi:MAG: hypothetical protein LQ340_006235 [Diploschistes diacapsis]|nr:MAG: hypothetical protein LQ340_006235 [Diploschistes diacapsis]